MAPKLSLAIVSFVSLALAGCCSNSCYRSCVKPCNQQQQCCNNAQSNTVMQQYPVQAQVPMSAVQQPQQAQLQQQYYTQAPMAQQNGGCNVCQQNANNGMVYQGSPMPQYADGGCQTCQNGEVVSNYEGYPVMEGEVYPSTVPYQMMTVPEYESDSVPTPDAGPSSEGSHEGVPAPPAESSQSLRLPTPVENPAPVPGKDSASLRDSRINRWVPSRRL